MIDRRSFAERFEAVVVPPPIHTGELDADPIVQETTERFFEEIMKSTQLGQRALSMFFRMDVQMLVPRVPTTEQIRFTDDSLQTFDLDGEQTLAIVHKMRNQGNYLLASFAKFTPTQRTIEVIEELQTMEAIIDGTR